MKRPKGLYILHESVFAKVYGPSEQRDIAELVDIPPRAWSSTSALHDRELLSDVEVIFSSWGAPRLDRAFLDSAPKLKAFFFGAGAAGGLITDAMWDRGIQITTAYAANAVPVAEFSLAMIFWCLKHGPRYAREMRERKSNPHHWPVPGAYGSTVGIVSLGMTGRCLLEMLRRTDLKLIAYDPFVSPEAAKELGVSMVSLAELFRTSDVVSLHPPLLDETRGMITGSHIASMKSGSTLLNTSRGGVIREPEMIDVLRKRPDIQAVLDVTEPEPPVADSPLFTLPNVLLTPHIAGSMDDECRRMGRSMVDELRRYLAGEPLKWGITKESSKNTTHRPKS